MKEGDGQNTSEIANQKAANSKVILRKSVLRDIDYLLAKNWLTEEEIYNLVKNFLKSYLEIKYEFTKEELFGELKNMYLPYTIRNDFFKFIDKIFLFEYSNIKYTEDELKSLLKEFKSFIDYLLVPTVVEKSVQAVLLTNVRKNMVSWLSKLMQKQKLGKKYVEPKPDSFVDREVVENKPLTSIEHPIDEHTDINSLIEKIYLSMDNNDLESAALLYSKVLNKYRFLSPDEKSSYYSRLTEIYNTIKEKTN